VNIYSDYFKILEKYFSTFYKASVDNNISPIEIAEDVKNTPRLFGSLKKLVPEIKSSIESYWAANYNLVTEKCRSLSGFKTRFGGDIGPQKSHNTIERVSIFFDTTIIPDPILRILTLPTSLDVISYYLVKYAIDQILYKEVYLMDISPPIAILVPDKELVGNEKYNFSELSNYGSIDSVIITNKLYNENLNSFDDALKFYSKFKNIDHAYREIIDGDIIWWDETVPRNLLDQLDSIKKKAYEHFDKNKFPYEVNDPRFLLTQLSGRLMQINDVLVRSNDNNASPLVTAPVSFHWLKQKIIANQNIFFEGKYQDKNINLGITNALLSEKTDWLDNLTITQVASLRKNGSVADLRKIIKSEIESLGNIKIDELERIANQVDYNLNNALLKHQLRLNEIQSELKKDITSKGISFLASATFAIQPLIGNFLPIWSSYVGGLTGLTNLNDIISTIKKFLRQKNKIKQSPVGILFESRNNG
jgi:hypothetical protein